MDTSKTIGVLGAGTWGCALARLLANYGNDVVVWSALPDEVASLAATHEQKNLPGVKLPESILFTGDIAQAVQDRDIVVFATPSPFVRSTAAAVAPLLSQGQVLVTVAKGIEADTISTMSEVIEDELSKHDAAHVEVAALSGPTHAEEVSRDLPSAIVAACRDLGTAETVQDVFMGPAFRVYTNTDILGVELCGALKNAIALASGISAGLGYGDNSRAALITRGMEEIKRLGLARGCNERTFDGLAGIGDLVVTATSMHSRNNRAGMLMGQGKTAEEAKAEVGMVVEGMNVLPAALRLAALHGVSMPIVEGVNAIVNEGAQPADVVAGLMGRDKKAELPVAQLHAGANGNERTSSMKRVITYGTYDLLHYGHINLLKRARALGDYLVVALSTDEFNLNEKGKKCYFSYEQRKALLESVRYVDLVIPEQGWDQKRSDVHEYHIDTFVIGDDWQGEFDFLKEEGVEVVYLPRTPEISTTQIKADLGDAEGEGGNK